jgi:hypothetical protein
LFPLRVTIDELFFVIASGPTPSEREEEKVIVPLPEPASVRVTPDAFVVTGALTKRDSELSFAQV